MPLVQGATFAGYTILRPLGSGGMGEVYLAQHPRLPRREALKILRTDVSADDEYRQRFIREADLAAALWHPNIVQVHDRGEFDAQLWIAMDYVDGTDAASLLRDRYPVGMPADEVATIIAAIASALDYAHQHDLLHRDVKPANILLTNPNDGDQRILLGDFGIARNMGEISGLTATNTTIGTLPYAAPEQLMDEPIDGRADQYALAATAYHLLTGKPPFPQTNPAAVISHHLNTPPPQLADTRPELAALDPVLAVALAKDPADRFASCTDFARSFAEAARSGGHATASASTRAAPLAARPPESTAVPSAQADTDKQKRGRRRRIILVAAAITVVTFTAIGVVGYMIQPKKHTPSTPATGIPTPPAAVLDGAYRLDFDDPKATINGAPSGQKEGHNTWWAFRSSCAPTGCVATGTQLDNNNHQVTQTEGGGDRAVFRFLDGRWQETPDRTWDPCGTDKTRVTVMAVVSVKPQADGTLQGDETDTFIGNECGRGQGSVSVTPVLLVREGDVPPGVATADPATVSMTPMASSPAAAVAGPILDGTYRVDFDEANQTINGAPTDLTTKDNETHWWAFRSVCTTGGCVATGTWLSDNNQRQAVGVAIVLRFIDGHWQNTPFHSAAPCPGKSGSVTENLTDRWSWMPQPDGTLRGAGTQTALTDECGLQGTVWRTPIVVTRTDDVPNTVTIADPAFFTDPALFAPPPAPPTTGPHP